MALTPYEQTERDDFLRYLADNDKDLEWFEGLPDSAKDEVRFMFKERSAGLALQFKTIDNGEVNDLRREVQERLGGAEVSPDDQAAEERYRQEQLAPFLEKFGKDL